MIDSDQCLFKPTAQLLFPYLFCLYLVHLEYQKSPGQPLASLWQEEALAHIVRERESLQERTLENSTMRR